MSSASSSGSTSSDKVSRLLKKQDLNAEGDSDEEAELAHNRRRAMLRTAIIWFSPTKPLPEYNIPLDTQFGIHRALFPPLDNVQEYLGQLKRMQLDNQKEVDGEERRITMLMVAGGHFAGMVVGIRPRGKGEKQDIKGSGDVRVIKSKTFHRYTSESTLSFYHAVDLRNRADMQPERSKEVLKDLMIMRSQKQSRQERCCEDTENLHYKRRLGH